MLTSLQIQNYALIDRLDIDFRQGFTVITGETGAGKSILLGALSLILGQRADTRVLSDPKKKCIIEGSFDVSQVAVQDFFSRHGLDYEPLSYFRREINPQGKSRAFINDTPVNLPLLKELAEQLIDIHSQHQHLMIATSSFQFDVLDGFSNNVAGVAAFRKEYQQLLQQQATLRQLVEREENARADLDYFRFQLDELEKTRLDADAFRQWEADLEVQQHTEDILQRLQKAAYLMHEGETSAFSMLTEIGNQLKPLGRFSPRYQELSERIDSMLIEIRDMGRELEDLSGTLTHDPEKALLIEQQLDQVNKLLLKHRVSEVAQLIAIRDSLRKEIASIHSLEEDIGAVRQALELTKAGLLKQAADISGKRVASIPAMEKEIMSLLKQLGMPQATFRIECQQDGELSPNGMDRMQFLFAANLGSQPRKISEVASGGEISRLMLAIKSLISQKNLLPSIIFDEIDTGISGEIGGKIGHILKDISSRMQVIAITHLPQIAAMGDRHLLVYKKAGGGKTTTHIQVLNAEERVEEIAKMMGGADPDPAMKDSARILLKKPKGSQDAAASLT